MHPSSPRRIGPILMCIAAIAAATPPPPLMSVQVKKAELRASASFLSAVTDSLQYGDRVAVDQQNGAWFKVKKPETGATGWLHTSALTKKVIVMKAGEGTQTGASSGEMALAGKGFNADVEKEFKASHKDVDFAPVDRMLGFKVTPSDIRAFVREGDLNPQGGVQ